MIRKLLRYAVVSSLVIASAIYLLVYFGSGWLTGIFNSGQNASIALLAEPGLKIYFIGFFFAGVNIIVCMYLSAAENAMKAFLISVARGCVILVPMAFLLSAVWGMTGVWMAFVAAEGLVSILAVLMIFVKKTS